MGLTPTDPPTEAGWYSARWKDRVTPEGLRPVVPFEVIRVGSRNTYPVWRWRRPGGFVGGDRDEVVDAGQLAVLLLREPPVLAVLGDFDWFGPVPTPGAQEVRAPAPTAETLVGAMLGELGRQHEAGKPGPYSDASRGLREVLIDGTVDLIALAGAVLAMKPPAEITPAERRRAVIAAHAARTGVSMAAAASYLEAHPLARATAEKIARAVLEAALAPGDEWVPVRGPGPTAATGSGGARRGTVRLMPMGTPAHMAQTCTVQDGTSYLLVEITHPELAASGTYTIEQHSLEGILRWTGQRPTHVNEAAPGIRTGTFRLKLADAIMVVP